MPVISVIYELKLNFLGRITKNFQFHANAPHGSRVVASGQTDGRTDMTKIKGAFRNFSKAPKNQSVNIV
jgi:hypothetical protein